MTSTSDRSMPSMVRYSGWLLRSGIWALLVSGAFLLVAVGISMWRSSQMPEEAPLARMYRAETDLTALGRAVEAYHREHGTYPPPGTEGLVVAIETVSRHADYYGGGPMLDPWERPYVYLPHTAYDELESLALVDADGSYRFPETFQLYSRGASGEAAIDDTIVFRDTDRPWRDAYKELHHAYDD